MNNNFRNVLNGHKKSNRCKCINCEYGIIDIFSDNMLNNKNVKIETEEPTYREVVSERFEKINFIL